MSELQMISSNMWLRKNTRISSFFKSVWKSLQAKAASISKKIKEDWARGEKINIALNEAKNQMHTKPHLFMHYK